MWQPKKREFKSVIRDVFKHNRLRSPVFYKSSRLHVDILRISFNKFWGVYSIDSSKMIGDFPAVLNFNRLFLKLNRFICN